MQMLTREQSINKSSASGLKDKSGKNQHVHALEDDTQLTKNMNNATAKLNLLSVNDELSMEEDEEEEEEEFDDAMEREVDSKVDTSCVVQRGNLTDLSFGVDPDSEDEEGEDFSGDDLRVHPGDHSLDQDYDTALQHQKYLQEGSQPTMLTCSQNPSLSRSFYGTQPVHHQEA